MTAQYNAALRSHLSIPVKEIPRLETAHGPISASAVRSLLSTGQEDTVRALVPPTTFDYLRDHALL